MSRTQPHKARLSRRAAILIVVGFAVVIATALAAASSTPAACASCHAMKPFVAGLEKGPHAQVHCYSCHIDQPGWGFPAFKANEWGKMFLSELAGRSVSGPPTPISSKRCLACHRKVMDDVVDKDGLRIDHKSCAAPPAECTDCHGGTAHGKAARWPREVVMEDCIRCHRTQRAPMKCDTCHAGRGQAERLRKGPWQITHAATWSKTHGLGDLRDCVTCHPESKCVSCHGTVLPHPTDFGRTHGTESLKRGAKCAQCHDKSAFCDTCHGLRMPHPAGFLKEHSKDARALGQDACLKCHIVEDCRDCHLRHIHPGRTDGTIGKGPNGEIAMPKSGGAK